MKYITRFNPTPNGDLHLGHVYILLFNEYVARTSGGELIVRFEDNSIDTMRVMSASELNRFTLRHQEAIDWLEIPVNRFERQSEMDQRLKEFVAKNSLYIPQFKFPFSLPLNPVYGDYNPEQGEWFGYAPYYTYCKVIYDELRGVNMLIRGDDLRSEFALYQHFRAEMRLKTIEHYYMPRVYRHDDAIVSKFHAAKSILEYRGIGWRPGDIIELLAKSVLKQPGEGWHLSNVKGQPRLDKAFSI